MEDKVRKGRGRSTGVFSFISRIPYYHYSFMVVFNEDDGVPCSPITCSFHAGKKEKVQQHVQEGSSDSFLLSSETWKANWI